MLCWLLAIAQMSAQPLSLDLQGKPEDRKVLESLKDYSGSFDNLSSAKASLSAYVQALRNGGYMEASFDSLRQDSSLLRANLHLGPIYEWVELQLEGLEPNVYDRAGYRGRRFKARPVSIPELQELQNNLLLYLQDHGYPFAKSELKDLHFDGQQMKAVLHTEPGKQLRLDTLSIIGNARISRRYLQNYLDLQPGDLYSESRLLRISNRIRELPFLEEVDPAQVHFIGDQAKIRLSLKQKPSSRFDLVLGLLPRTDNSGYTLTGDGELYLSNPFGLGETIGLEYESYPQKSQEIIVKFKYPYLPVIPLGFDIDFDLYRRDTIWSDTHFRLGLNYQVNGRYQLRAFFDRNRSVPNSLDPSSINPNSSLPRVIGLLTNAYGLGLRFDARDYRLNPRRGLFMDLSASIGRKSYPNLNILEEAGIEVPEEKNLQWRLGALLEKYTALGNSSTLKSAYTAAAIIQDTAEDQSLIFDNELYRIGGNKLLRGFDEESINVLSYQLLTVEARYLLTRNSYAAFFVDLANLQQKDGLNEEQLWLYGFGPVLSFETKAGVFALSYALGQQLGANIDFRSGKVHFGYINYF